MSDQFTNDLEARLSAFVENISPETLSDAFKQANFEGYRHLEGTFFGLGDGTFDEILVSATGEFDLKLDTLVFNIPQSVMSFAPVSKAADHQDLALAA